MLAPSHGEDGPLWTATGKFLQDGLGEGEGGGGEEPGEGSRDVEEQGGGERGDKRERIRRRGG